MGKVIHFTDNKILLKDGDKVLFFGSVEEVSEIIGKNVVIPDKVIEAVYDVDSKSVTAFSKTGQMDVAKWPAGAEIAKKLSAIELRGNEQRNPKVEEPVAQEPIPETKVPEQTEEEKEAIRQIKEREDAIASERLKVRALIDKKDRTAQETQQMVVAVCEFIGKFLI